MSMLLDLPQASCRNAHVQECVYLVVSSTESIIEEVALPSSRSGPSLPHTGRDHMVGEHVCLCGGDGGASEYRERGSKTRDNV